MMTSSDESTIEDRDHARFTRHLTDSHDSVWKVAQWLFKRGHHVRVGQISRPRKRDEWRENTDNGDIEISLRIEVKHLSTQFTGRDDWPFPDFIVCATGQWDRAVPKPYAYVYISKDNLHLAVLKGDSSKLWTMDRRKDRRYEGVEQDFYLAPMERVWWGSFDD